MALVVMAALYKHCVLQKPHVMIPVHTPAGIAQVSCRLFYAWGDVNECDLLFITRSVVEATHPCAFDFQCCISYFKGLFFSLLYLKRLRFFFYIASVCCALPRPRNCFKMNKVRFHLINDSNRSFDLALFF